MSQSWQTYSVSKPPSVVLYCPPYIRALWFYKTVKLWLTQAKIITFALVKVFKQSSHLFECVADLIDNIWACLHRWVWLCILLKTQRTDWPVVESRYYKGQYFFVGWAFWSLFFFNWKVFMLIHLNLLHTSCLCSLHHYNFLPHPD